MTISGQARPEGSTQEENKRVVLAHFDALSAGDAEAFGSTHAADGVNHAPAAFDLSDWPEEGKPFGPAQARETLVWLREGVPDSRIEVEALLAEDDQVVAWIRVTGTRNGRAIDFRNAHRFRIRDGKIVEHWAVRDDLRAMLQAGVVSPPGPPAGRS